jgi:hypothetical protein
MNANAANSLAALKAGIPKANAARFDELVNLTDAFCDARLDADYKALCRKMVRTICLKRSLSIGGKSEGWAAGIVYALGQVNFLTDPNQSPHATSAEIAAAFGVSMATMMAKAKTLREKLRLIPFHPEWCVASIMENNPLVWILKVNGVVMDIRTAPREAQIVAYEQGLIPYLP